MDFNLNASIKNEKLWKFLASSPRQHLYTDASLYISNLFGIYLTLQSEILPVISSSFPFTKEKMLR